ncbi:YqgE/AlgH family protein [Rhodopirellula sp. JC740]|uniref:YqgE/AlgH family protein n=1 Tax=Rhodopirellula halodulae TaxID=2894198 RepID=A0ABS8NE48_9BACT|nr:YqgE/AlgH family protein [Rhodopirellula sp. JC740]MCC9641821.1 YqgE/AlgH family protein [Rhodopirellula sp. JC740]
MQNVQAGDLLVSSTLVDGTVLNQAVCLLVHEDVDHVIGLMLNRPMQAVAGNLSVQPNPSAETPKLPRWGRDPSAETDESSDPSESQPDSPQTPVAGVPMVVVSGDQKDKLAQQLIAGKLSNGTPLHFGGPLSGPIVAVHASPEFAEAEMESGICLAAQRDNIESLLKSDEHPFRLVVGHLGWTAEQLENEISEGVWHRIPATSDLLDSDDASMWPRMIHRATANSVARWLDTTDVPGAAELN